MEPRAPRLLTWAVVGRVVGRGVAALTLLAVLALVAWPERRNECLGCQLHDSMLGAQRTENELRRQIADLAAGGNWYGDVAALDLDAESRRLEESVPCVRPGNCPRDSSLAVLLGD